MVHWNIVLTIFHNDQIYMGLWKIVGITLQCMVVLQSQGDWPKNAGKHDLWVQLIYFVFPLPLFVQLPFCLGFDFHTGLALGWFLFWYHAQVTYGHAPKFHNSHWLIFSSYFFFTYNVSTILTHWTQGKNRREFLADILDFGGKKYSFHSVYQCTE